MGGCTSKIENTRNKKVKTRGSLGPMEDKEGETYMLICGIDYACDFKSWAGPRQTGRNPPLDTKYAWNFMRSLAAECGIENVTTLFNEQCTAQGIKDAIAEVASQCEEGDTFIFYYTGHGDQLPQDDYDEVDEANDQCLCTVGPDGCCDDVQPNNQYRAAVWLRDDDIAETICENIDEGAQVLLIIDACHSGSIADFGPNSLWAKKGIQAISMSGCQDNETSSGTGKGGYFTRSLTQAIQELHEQQADEQYSVADIHNATLRQYQAHKGFQHTQHISIHGNAIYPHEFVWPLHPVGDYQSPANAPPQGYPGMW